MLHPLAQKALGFKQAVGVFEIERAAVEKRAIPVYEPISKFPSVRRDFAFVIEKSVAVSALTDLIYEVGGNIVKDVNIFDVFEDASLGDKRSVAVGVISQALEHTLEDAEVESADGRRWMNEYDTLSVTEGITALGEGYLDAFPKIDCLILSRTVGSVAVTSELVKRMRRRKVLIRGEYDEVYEALEAGMGGANG